MKLRFQDLIIYEDDNFVVVGKPPFLSTLEDRNDPNNLQQLAKLYNEGLSACHRLDKDTSGAVLFAKNENAYRHASVQFEERKITKVYHAVVDGVHDFEGHEVNLPILPSNRGVVKVDFRKGKEATTFFTALEQFRQHSLIECRPISGRMHQIRIHLAKQNASIVNDDRYGGKPVLLSNLKRKYNTKPDREEQPLIKRFALHAKSIGFNNFSKQIEVTSDYPKDMMVLLKQLRKNKR